jgi:hypothetical protein
MCMKNGGRPGRGISVISAAVNRVSPGMRDEKGVKSQKWVKS